MSKNIIVFLLAAGAIVSLGSCSHQDEDAIPRSDMEAIFHDMALAEGYLELNSHLQRQLDTLALYQPIIEQYGYDCEQFRKSIRYYVGDIEEFKDMLASVKKRLEDEEKELTTPAKLEREEAKADTADTEVLSLEGETPQPEDSTAAKPKRKRSREKQINIDDIQLLEEKLK